MAHLNVEIKARCRDARFIRDFLLRQGADFRGTDNQLDTYFQVPQGRLKLREGNIENHLIFYRRPDQSGPKISAVSLYSTQRDSPLKAILTQALGVLVVVDKEREIYFLGNVKFHIDKVKALGCFVEIEAIDRDNAIGPDALREQCRHYMEQFKLEASDLLSGSYSDMLLELQANETLGT